VGVAGLRALAAETYFCGHVAFALQVSFPFGGELRLDSIFPKVFLGNTAYSQPNPFTIVADLTDKVPVCQSSFKKNHRKHGWQGNPLIF
jgi:hypothetical protein